MARGVLRVPRMQLNHLASLLTVIAVTACGDSPSNTSPDTSDTTDTTDTAGPDDGDATDETDTPGTTDTSDTPETDAGPTGPTTWDERFEAVIPSTGVVELRLEFEPGAWQSILDMWLTQKVKVERRAVVDHGPLAHPAIGVRLKGLSSLVFPNGADPGGKYPLKLDFNSQGGERLHGVDELALNSSINDPSYVRDWLTAEMYRRTDVPVAKIGYAEVSIVAPELGETAGQVGERHIGLQPLSQVIDKRFLKHVFGEADHADDGNLYKCTYNRFGACAFFWLGNSPSDYVKTTDCAEGYDECGLILQTNEDDPTQNTYADVLALIEVLELDDDTELAARLPDLFDVDHFLRLSAVTVATGNMDSYFGRGHNYYLYRRADGRFQMIPWDFDLAYARGCNSGYEDPTCGGLDTHPLVKRILAIAAWRDTYLDYLCEVGTTLMTPELHTTWLTTLDTRIADRIATDPNADYAAYRAEVDLETGTLMAFVAEQQAMLLGACDHDRGP
jgi:hypothetical protein